MQKQQLQTEDRITQLELEIKQKIDNKEFKKKWGKMKIQREKMIDQLGVELREEMKDKEDRLRGEIIGFEEIVKDVERKTLWKIHDCNDLLLKRVNEEYV